MSDIFFSMRSTECGCEIHHCAAATSDIQDRLADINARVAPVLEEHTRLIGAVNKAVSLVLAMAAVGVLTFAVAARMEQEIKRADLIAQEGTWKR
ncbi:hypothetical protein EVC14_038 [Rhizobium phage RHph_I3_18]|nr:hypothetical protein EVC14_038 [Rhizobium phage RHph_I3_18]